MLKILTKKEQEEIKEIKKENEFLSRGWRVMSIALDYQKAIAAILKTQNISEIEIDDKLLYTNEYEIAVSQTINHTTRIKLIDKEQKKKMRRCTKCNKLKSEDEFYAKWSHWCNDCIDKRKRNMKYKEFMRNGGIDGKENIMPMKTE